MRAAKLGKKRKTFTKEHIANIKAAKLKSKNSPEVLDLIQQYGSPLINLLRQKYYDLNYRCNDPNNEGYKNYGGRGIRNFFPTPDTFLLYVINELHIIKLSQIDGLQIYRIDNNSHYMPGNIRFITHKENQNNKRSSRRS